MVAKSRRRRQTDRSTRRVRDRTPLERSSTLGTGSRTKARRRCVGVAQSSCDAVSVSPSPPTHSHWLTNSRGVSSPHPMAEQTSSRGPRVPIEAAKQLLPSGPGTVAGRGAGALAGVKHGMVAQQTPPKNPPTKRKHTTSERRTRCSRAFDELRDGSWTPTPSTRCRRHSRGRHRT